MQSLVKYIPLLPCWAVCIQLFCYRISLQGVRKQRECRTLGIILTSIGVVSLVSRDFWYVLSGLALIMLGLRLLATGLDRIDKKIHIDRFEDDNEKAE
jgi:hypothetical protein